MSVKEQIWKALKQHKSLTILSTFSYGFGCTSLSQRIGELKKEKSTWLYEHKKAIKTRQFNNNNYGIYWLASI